MRNVYKLTSYDEKLEIITSEHFYSNLKVAKESFESLKSFLISKHELDSEKVEIKKWFFSHGGANKTEIINGKFNITLTEWTLSKEASVWK